MMLPSSVTSDAVLESQEDRVHNLLARAVAEPLAAHDIIKGMSAVEIEEADLQMAAVGRARDGHLETPARSGDPAQTVCDSCGPLDGRHPFMLAYHPANRDYLP